jgi:hypothetical protein
LRRGGRGVGGNQHASEYNGKFIGARRLLPDVMGPARDTLGGERLCDDMTIQG